MQKNFQFDFIKYKKKDIDDMAVKVKLPFNKTETEFFFVVDPIVVVVVVVVGNKVTGSLQLSVLQHL